MRRQLSDTLFICHKREQNVSLCAYMDYQFDALTCYLSFPGSLELSERQNDQQISSSLEQVLLFQNEALQDVCTGNGKQSNHLGFIVRTVVLTLAYTPSTCTNNSILPLGDYIISESNQHSPFVRVVLYTLQWRHNGLDGASNHQPHDCLLSRWFGRRSKKTSKLCVTGLCAGNSLVTGQFPAQMASNTENVSIWWRHHVQYFVVQGRDIQRV